MTARRDCPSCGAAIAEEAKFCHSCGVSLTGPGESVGRGAAQRQPTSSEQQNGLRVRAETREKRSGRGILKGLGIGCLSLVAVLVVVFVLLVVAIAVLAETEDDPSDSLASAQAGIGQSIISANWQVMVPRPPTKAPSLSQGFQSAQAKGVFIVVPLTVRNIGNEGSTFFKRQVKLRDSLGREFDAGDLTVQSAAGDGLYLEEINPGLSISTVVAFDVPKNAAGLQLKIEGALFSDPAFVNLGVIR